MLIIQLDKTDCEILYNGNYFAMIDANDGIVFDDSLITEAFTFGLLSARQNFNNYMKEMQEDYVYFDLKNYQFIKEIPLK